MKVKFIQSWRFYSRGEVIDAMPDGMANTLVKRGIVQEVREIPEPKSANPFKKKGK